ncbi:hypothetical protein NDU88_002683 [Pleurodeles waltl]|uniref:Uncharacterized protein n=1 Tax=Pleurodeles waltl TaxID=8319 RepID=A0AAV7UWC0_PLEWA|nr:hypothetical protein NDU88_002683 [Pleurodeles waltl]
MRSHLAPSGPSHNPAKPACTREQERPRIPGPVASVGVLPYWGNCSSGGALCTTLSGPVSRSWFWPGGGALCFRRSIRVEPGIWTPGEASVILDSRIDPARSGPPAGPPHVSDASGGVGACGGLPGSPAEEVRRAPAGSGTPGEGAAGDAGCRFRAGAARLVLRPFCRCWRGAAGGSGSVNAWPCGTVKEEPCGTRLGLSALFFLVRALSVCTHSG